MFRYLSSSPPIIPFEIGDGITQTAFAYLVILLKLNVPKLKDPTGKDLVKKLEEKVLKGEKIFLNDIPNVKLTELKDSSTKKDLISIFKEKIEIVLDQEIRNGVKTKAVFLYCLKTKIYLKYGESWFVASKVTGGISKVKIDESKIDIEDILWIACKEATRYGSVNIFDENPVFQREKKPKPTVVVPTGEVTIPTEEIERLIKKKVDEVKDEILNLKNELKTFVTQENEKLKEDIDSKIREESDKIVGVLQLSISYNKIVMKEYIDGRTKLTMKFVRTRSKKNFESFEKTIVVLKKFLNNFESVLEFFVRKRIQTVKFRTEINELKHNELVEYENRKVAGFVKIDYENLIKKSVPDLKKLHKDRREKLLKKEKQVKEEQERVEDVSKRVEDIQKEFNKDVLVGEDIYLKEKNKLEDKLEKELKDWDELDPKGQRKLLEEKESGLKAQIESFENLVQSFLS